MAALRKTPVGLEFSYQAVTLIAVVVGLLTGVFSYGVAAGVADRKLDGKLDKSEYLLKHQADSIDNTVTTRRIDLLEMRLSRLICYKNPSPDCP